MCGPTALLFPNSIWRRNDLRLRVLMSHLNTGCAVYWSAAVSTHCRYEQNECISGYIFQPCTISHVRQILWLLELVWTSERWWTLCWSMYDVQGLKVCVCVSACVWGMVSCTICTHIHHFAFICSPFLLPSLCLSLPLPPSPLPPWSYCQWLWWETTPWRQGLQHPLVAKHFYHYSGTPPSSTSSNQSHVTVTWSAIH